MSNLIPNESEFILYTAPNGSVKLTVLMADESIWLTQKSIAALFGVGVPAISKHLSNIFESEELVKDSVISILETTAQDGKEYNVTFYAKNIKSRLPIVKSSFL
jgi:hypothetical protein